MSFRTQTVNHALGGRLIVAKRDNSHEMIQRPRPDLKVEFVVVDSDSLETKIFTDSVSLARHIRQEELRIQDEERALQDAAAARMLQDLNS